MEISWNCFISQNGGIIPQINLGLTVMPMGGKETLNTFLNAKIGDIYNCLIFFLLLYCHQHHSGGYFSWGDKKQKDKTAML